MTANLNKVFDIGGISLDDNYNLIISSKLKYKKYIEGIKKEISLPKDKNHYPCINSIKYHRNYIFNT